MGFDAVQVISWVVAFEMAATTTHGVSMAALRSCVPPKGLGVKLGLTFVGVDVKEASWTGLRSSTCISSRKSLLPRSSVCNRSSGRGVTQAMSAADAKPTLPGLPVDLRGNHFLGLCLFGLIVHGELVVFGQFAMSLLIGGSC